MTANTPTSAASDRIEKQVTLDASRARVWKALTEAREQARAPHIPRIGNDETTRLVKLVKRSGPLGRVCHRRKCA